MPVIHADPLIVSTMTAWCPWCQRDTEQAVEHAVGGDFIHWCHDCLIPRKVVPQGFAASEGGQHGRF